MAQLISYWNSPNTGVNEKQQNHFLFVNKPGTNVGELVIKPPKLKLGKGTLSN